MKGLSACALVVLVVVGSPRLSAAQSTSATVFGTTSDEQRRVLPGVTVTLLRIETGESRTVTTDTRGAFRIIGLNPGRYELRATLPPFVDVIQSDLVLGLNDETAVAVIL